MRFSCRSIAAVLLLYSPHALLADPSPPRQLRSFRPIVPIKQNVRGGMDQMKSQSVKLTIPPPPIPESASPSDESGTPETSLAMPPEPVASDSDNESDPGETEVEEADTPPAPEATVSEKDSAPIGGPTLAKLREEAHALAGKNLTYVFGAANPDSGGLDCSATIQYLLKKIGVKDVPRTSYDQYYWLKRKKLLDDVYGKSADKKMFKKLSPGDLIFWGGTWKSGHRVSHVMLYMGYDPATDKHYVFGARGKSKTGLTGSGVDIFELDAERGRLIAHGKIPGLVY